MSQDDLRSLWHNQVGSPVGKSGEEMLTIAIERIRSLDRRITVRNTVECFAAALVVFVFARLAWKAPSTIEQVGFAIVAASGVWIAFYILRFGAAPSKLERGASLTDYRQMLADNYDRQICLLRNVKYWYLLPPYVGNLIAVFGTWSRHACSSWAAVATVCLLTVVFALIWILNELVGVRYLERLKREMLS